MAPKEKKRKKVEVEESDEEEDGEFVVARILDSRVDKNSEIRFLIKWEGWPDSANTWEPAGNLQCPERLEEFFRSPTGRKNKPDIDAAVAKVRKIWEQKIRSVVAGNPRTAEVTISLRNDVDLSNPPEVEYLISPLYPACIESAEQTAQFGCNCTTGCSREKGCACVLKSMNKSNHGAYRNGKLILGPGLPIYECNDSCMCSAECTNRVVQKGRKLDAEIFRTISRGWGVRTRSSFKQGEFVMEWIGEIITVEEADDRRAEYSACECSCVFDLAFNDGDPIYSIDSSQKGNLARFLNHSCDPNLAVWQVYGNNVDPNVPTLAFFAICDIARDEELTYDYQLPCGVNENKTLADGTDMDFMKECLEVGFPVTDGTPCQCGAKKCRKILF